MEYLLNPVRQVSLGTFNAIAKEEKISSEDKAKKYGIKTPPILDCIEVDHWLVQPLHCLMGIFDSVSKAHKKFLNLNVDDLCQEEAKLKGEVKILLDEMVPFEDEMTKFIDEHEADLNEHIVNWKDWVEYLKEPNLDEEEKLIGEEARKYHHGEKTRLNNGKKIVRWIP